MKPIHLAAQRGHLEIIKFFVETYGPEVLVDPSYPDGTTVVHLAAIRGFLEILRYCHEAKADLNVGDSGGFTPALEAGAYGRLDSLKTLNELGADLRKKSHRLVFTLAH